MSAGELSGDAHGANLITALHNALPDAVVDALGGPLMASAGANVIEPFDKMRVMGLAETVKNLPAHLLLLRRLKRSFLAGRYDLAVLIDYPGFHLRVAKAAAAAGIPVLYYIVPQLWAWGEWRAKSMRRSVRSAAVVLPFEETFFRTRGIEAEFVGHPLLDMPPPPSRSDARAAMGLFDDEPVLGLFPGSRLQEIRRLWPVFRKAATRLRRKLPGLKIVLAGTSGSTYPDDGDVINPYDARTVFAAADAALCKSGTTTLEAALTGTPMVIAYQMHPLTFAVARRVVKLRHVGLVNLIAGRGVAPEFLQREATPEGLAEAVARLFDSNNEAASMQRDAFGHVRNALGRPGASARVAEMARRLVA